MGRVASLAEVAAERDKLKAEGKSLVFTNGCFDILHLGHVRYLQQAREQGDLLVVGLNSDDSTRALKGPPRPLMPEEARAEIIASLTGVDYVVIFPQPTAEKLVAALKPDIYVKGGDYSSAKDIPEARIVADYGGRVVILPWVPGYSTSDLVDRIVQLYSRTQSALNQ